MMTNCMRLVTIQHQVLDEDHELDDDPNQQEEDQQHHFNLEEVNDTDSKNKGVGDENESIDPILIDEKDTGTDDESFDHVPEGEDEPEEEDDTTVGSDDGEEGEVGENDEQQQEEVPPASVPRPHTIQ